MLKRGAVYILTNKNHTVLYVGVSSMLTRRIFYHKIKKYKNSFTARYNVDHLVYFKVHNSIVEAIGREKQLKGWSRYKKQTLIMDFNPEWRDLFEDL